MIGEGVVVPPIDFSSEGILDDVRGLGHIFDLNKDGDVTGVCRHRDTLKTFEEYMEKVGAGDIPSSEKVVLLVRPIFTFANLQKTMRPIHTGVSERVMHAVVKEVIAKMYEGLIKLDEAGIDEEERKRDLDYLTRMSQALFQVDPRIYVPFAIHGQYPPLWQFYGRQSWHQAREILLEDIPIR